MNVFLEYLRQGKHVYFSSEEEVLEMLTMCDRLRLAWSEKTGALSHVPGGHNIYIHLNEWGFLRWGSMSLKFLVDESAFIMWRTFKAAIGGAPMFNY